MTNSNSEMTLSHSEPELPKDLTAQIDLLISLHLWTWPALSLAIQNSWGGSSQLSNDKRDWFAGAISDLLTSQPPQLQDVSDLEEVLLQVMVDEFEVVVDDGSAEELAKSIWVGHKKLKEGDMSLLTQIYGSWLTKKKKGGIDSGPRIIRGEDRDADETDWDEDEDDDQEEEEEWNGFADEDVAMSDAPPVLDSTKQKPKIEPEVDDEGFTKVVGKKRR